MLKPVKKRTSKLFKDSKKIRMMVKMLSWYKTEIKVMIIKSNDTKWW